MGGTRHAVTGGGHTCEQSPGVSRTLSCPPETKVTLCVKCMAIKQLRGEQVKITRPFGATASVRVRRVRRRVRGPSARAEQGKGEETASGKKLRLRRTRRELHSPRAHGPRRPGEHGISGLGKDSAGAGGYPVSRPQRTEGTSYRTPRDTPGKGLGRPRRERGGRRGEAWGHLGGWLGAWGRGGLAEPPES